MKAPHVVIYTDGSFRGSCNSGGYAALVTDDYGNWRLVGDGFMNTTISRMELSAMVAGLSILNDGCVVDIIADSMYAINVVNNWAWTWAKHNFKKSDGGRVSNQDIITQLMFHVNRMKKVTAYHISSHTGYTDTQSLGNEIVDGFAVQQALGAAGMPSMPTFQYEFTPAQYLKAAIENEVNMLGGANA